QQQVQGGFQAAVDATGDFVAAKKKLEDALAVLFKKLTTEQRTGLANSLNAIQGFQQEMSLLSFQLGVEKFPAFATEVIKLDRSTEPGVKAFRDAVEGPHAQAPVLHASRQASAATGGSYFAPAPSPYPPPFDATAGIRAPTAMPPGGIPGPAAPGLMAA